MAEKKVYRVVWGPHRFYLPIGVKTLIAFLLVISVLTGSFYYYSTFTLTRQTEEEALVNLSSRLQGAWRLYYSRMDQMKFGMLQAVSEQYIRSAIARKDRRFLQELLNGYAINRPYVDLWAVVDERGVVIGRRNDRTGDILEIGGVVSKALRSGEVVQSTERVEKEVLAIEGSTLAARVERSGLMQVVVTPVVSGGRVKGAFVTGILLNGYEWLPNAIYEHFSTESAVFGSILQDSRVIASTAVPKSIFSPMIRVPEGIMRPVIERKGFKGALVLEGERAYIVAEPIQNMVGEAIGGIAVGVSGRVVGHLIETIHRKILLYTGLGVILSLILAGLAYRDTVKPINALTSAMHDATGGNLGVRVEVKTKDEFEDLGKGFNEMIENIEIREHRLDRFNELSKLLITSLDPETLLRMALTRMVELTDSHMGIVYLHEEAQGLLRPVVSVGVGEGELRTLKVGEGMAGLCAIEKKAVILKDIPEDSLLLEAGFAKVRPKGVVWFAMCYKEELLGVFAIGSLQSYNEDEIRHMEYLVAQIAIALDNALIHEKVERLSITDPLTGLYNRRHFFDRLDTEFAEAKRYNHHLSIVIMDIDDFKVINDTMGHQQGDTVLRELGRILKDETRAGDVWARYGGEEFIGYLPHCGKDEAFKLAEKLRRMVEGYAFSGMDERRITITLGVGYYPHPEVETVDDLVGIADGLLYRGKAGGKNRVVVA